MFYQDSSSDSGASGNEGHTRKHVPAAVAAPSTRATKAREVSLPEAEESVRAFGRSVEDEAAVADVGEEVGDSSSNRLLHIETTRNHRSGGRGGSAGGVAQVRQFNPVSSSSASDMSGSPNVRVFRKVEDSSDSDDDSDRGKTKDEGGAVAVPAAKKASALTLRRLPLASISSDDSSSSDGKGRNKGDRVGAADGLRAGGGQSPFPPRDGNVVVGTGSDDDSSLTLDSVDSQKREVKREEVTAHDRPRSLPPPPPYESSDTTPANHKDSTRGGGNPTRQEAAVLDSLVSIGDVDTMSLAISDVAQAAIDAQELQAPSEPSTSAPAGSISFTADIAVTVPAIATIGPSPTPADSSHADLQALPATMEHSVTVTRNPRRVSTGDAGGGNPHSSALDTHTVPCITGADDTSASTMATTSAATVERQAAPQPRRELQGTGDSNPGRRTPHAMGSMRPPSDEHDDGDTDGNDDTLTYGSENSVDDSSPSHESADSREELDESEIGAGAGFERGRDEEGGSQDEEPSISERHDPQLPPGCPAAEDTADDDEEEAEGDEASEGEAQVGGEQSPAEPTLGGPTIARAPGDAAETRPRVAPLDLAAGQQRPPCGNESQKSGSWSSLLRQPQACSSPREYPGHPRGGGGVAVGGSSLATEDEAASALARARALFPMEESDRWNGFLSATALTDVTAVSAVYHLFQRAPDEYGERDEAMVKVLSVRCQPPVNITRTTGSGDASVGIEVARQQDHSIADALNLDEEEEEGAAAAADATSHAVTGSAAPLSASRRQERSAMQDAALCLALDMYDTQQRMADAGLMGRGFHSAKGNSVLNSGSRLAEAHTHEDVYTENNINSSSPYGSGGGNGREDGVAVCRGLRSLHVDSECRLIAALDIEPCCITVSDFMAYQAFPLAAGEVVAILKSCTAKLAALHSCGFAHGALHGGNVLLSADDGHCTLTQPHGIMSAYGFPSDLSTLSPARAHALLRIVDRIWPENAAEEVSGIGGRAPGEGGRKRLGQRPTPLDPEEKLAWLMLETLGGGARRDAADGSRRAPHEHSGYAHCHVPTMQDDLYAVATLAVLLLLGVPVFHGAQLHEVVRTLVDVFPQRGGAGGASETVVERFVLRALRTGFAALRYHQAGYSEAFLGEMEAFIGDCLVASCSACDGDTEEDEEEPKEESHAPRYRNAVDLLTHPLLQTLADEQQREGREAATVSTMTEDAEESSLKDMIHRLVYPVYTSIESTKSACGTKPYIARLHRNSIFAARHDALRSSLLREHSCGARSPRREAGKGATAALLSLPSAMAEGVDGLDVVASLWPYLEGQAARWTVPFPSVYSCYCRCLPDAEAAAAATTTTSAATQRERGGFGGTDRPIAVAEAFFPTRSPSLCLCWGSGGAAIAQDGGVSNAVRENLEVVKECAILANLHTLLFQGKEAAALKLSRGDLEPLRGIVDTLVLKDLDHCYVEVTTHMRFIVLANVRHCEILLGPCFACCVCEVYDCPTMAVASSHLMLDRVERVGLFYSGPTPPTAFAAPTEDDETTTNDVADSQRRRSQSCGGRSLNDESDPVATVKQVRMQSYGLTYPGLSEDFAAVGLAQEHLSTVHSSFYDADAGVESRDGDDDANGEAPGGRPLADKQLTVLVPEATGHDYPYSHALAACGNRFIHRDDNESDVYFFFNELQGKDIHIIGIHGGGGDSSGNSSSSSRRRIGQGTASSAVGHSVAVGGAATASDALEAMHKAAGGDGSGVLPGSVVNSSSRPSRSSLYRDMQRHRQLRADAAGGGGGDGGEGARGPKAGQPQPSPTMRGDAEGEKTEDSAPCEAPRYPLIFILDVVEDVVIRDCSECTVFVLGSRGSVVIEDCRSMRVFALARESVVENCVDVDVFAFVTEYMGVVNCQRVMVAPLYVQCPYFDAILESVLLETTEEEKDSVYAAFDERNIAALNIVLQGAANEDGSTPAGDRMVGLSGCTDTFVKDVQWFEEHSPIANSGIAAEDVDLPFLIHVKVPLNEPGSGSGGSSTSSTMMHLKRCNFFFECIESDGRDIQDEYEHVALADLAYSMKDTEWGEVGVSGDTVTATAPLPLQRLHDLTNPSLLRLPGSFAIRTNAAVDQVHRGSTATADGPASDLVLERIAMGEIHLAEAAGNLFIRNCTGPLDIVVCAAQNVVMEGCENVILRTACFTFAAQDCQHCHIALHVNTRPRYLRCSDMLTSTLNITTVNMEALMTGAGVQEEVNLFHRPQIVSPDTPSIRFLHIQEHSNGGDGGGRALCSGAKRGRNAAALAAAAHALLTDSTKSAVSAHALCTECLCDGVGAPGLLGPRGLPFSGSLSASASLVALALGDHASTNVSPAAEDVALANADTLTRAFARLRSPITVVSPLPGLVVGVEEAAFLERLDSRVVKEELRAPAEDGIMSALTFLAESDLVALNESDAATKRLVAPPFPSQRAAKDGDAPVDGDDARDEERREAVPTYPMTVSADGETCPLPFSSAAAGSSGQQQPSGPVVSFSPTADAEELSQLDDDSEEDEAGGEAGQLRMHSNHLREQQQQQRQQEEEEGSEDIPEIVVAADGTTSLRESPRKTGEENAPTTLRPPADSSVEEEEEGEGTEVVHVRRRPGAPPPPPSPPSPPPQGPSRGGDSEEAAAGEWRAPAHADTTKDTSSGDSPRRETATTAVSPHTPSQHPQHESELPPPTPTPAKALADATTPLAAAATTAATRTTGAPGEETATALVEQPLGHGEDASPPPPPPPPPVPLPTPAIDEDHAAEGTAQVLSPAAKSDERSTSVSGMLFLAPAQNQHARNPVVDRYGDLGDSSEYAAEDDPMESSGTLQQRHDRRPSPAAATHQLTPPPPTAAHAEEGERESDNERARSQPRVLGIRSPLQGVQTLVFVADADPTTTTTTTAPPRSDDPSLAPPAVASAHHTDPAASLHLPANAELAHAHPVPTASSSLPSTIKLGRPHPQQQPQPTPVIAQRKANEAETNASVLSPLEGFTTLMEDQRALQGVSDTELRRARPQPSSPTAADGTIARTVPASASAGDEAAANTARMLAAPRDHSLHFRSTTVTATTVPDSVDVLPTPVSRSALRQALAEARAQHAQDHARVSDDELATRVARAVAKVGDM